MEERIKRIINVLDEKKAEDIEQFNLEGKDYIADAVIVATTLNNKHAFSLLNHLKNDLKPSGESFLRVDEDDNWTIIDLGDIIIHLMSQSHREKYSLDDFLKGFERN